ncbi:MAG: DUF11 domain-containing protein [Methanobrevibacter sp.]|jgi:uncharacterized repeat protein (TIGR01451 family)|nr:DUF11 domain-containing protein [Candidatus Methanovirga meridionalis]
MNLKPNIKIIVMLLSAIILVTAIGVYADVESQNATLNNLSINPLDDDLGDNSDDIYVDPLNGNDNGTGNKSSPYKSINTAVTNATNGTTIHLSNGNYTGVNNTNIKIDSNIAITGESDDGVIIDGKNAQDTRFFYCDGGEYNITFNNIIFQNGNHSLGGAIFVNNTNLLTISNCNFTNNHAVGPSGGGAIHFNCTLKLNNDQFINNSAPVGLGGALYSDGGDYSYTNNCTFIGNNATHGGAIDHVYGNNETIVNSVFINNTATSSGIRGGGAIHIHGVDDDNDDIRNQGFTIENCSFTGNHANDEGGAVHTEDANTQIINCNFTNNSAGDKGGAVFTSDFIGLKIDISNFTDNSAVNSGGAVFTSNSNGLEIDNSIFTNNINNTIFVSGNNSILTNLTIFNNTGYNDTSKDSRNALTFSGYNNTLNSSNITSNQGNGVWFTSGGENYLVSSTIINNTRNGVIIMGSSNNTINYNRIYENGLGMDIGMNLPNSNDNNINHNWWGYNDITNQINDTGTNTNNTDHYVLNLSVLNLSAPDISTPDISTLVNDSKIYNDSSMNNATLKYNFILNTSEILYDKPNLLPYFVVNVTFKNNTANEDITTYLDRDIRDPNSYNQLINFSARTNYSVEALSDGEDVMLDILSPLRANVTITKTANNTNVSNNTNINFTLTVRNDGPDNATNVTVKDLLNTSNFDYMSNNASANATYNDATGELTWNVGDLEVNQSASINISVKVIATGNLLNIANVTGDNTPPGQDNEDNVTIKSHPIYDAEITKTVNNKTPNIGDLVNYTITVKNLEDSQTFNVTDTLDSRLIYIPSNPSSNVSYDNNTISWNIGELEVNGTVSLNITVKVNGSGNITNLATLNASNMPPKNSSANITVNPPKYYAVINKTVNVTKPNIGDFIKYTITVKNLEDTQTVNVTDILDNRLIYNSFTSSKGNYDNNTGLWDIGELGVNETVSLDIIVKVNGSGKIANLAKLNTSNKRPKKSFAYIIVKPIKHDKPPINSDGSPINSDGYNFDLKNTGIPILVFLVLISIIGGTIYRKRK